MNEFYKRVLNKVARMSCDSDRLQYFQGVIDTMKEMEEHSNCTLDTLHSIRFAVEEDYLLLQCKEDF